MSHFYAAIPHSARRTVPTARGHKSTGISTYAASWAGRVCVDVWHNSKTGKDEFRVYQDRHSGAGISEEIASGVIGEETEADSATRNL